MLKTFIKYASHFLAMLCLVSFSSPSQAQSLWQFADQSDYQQILSELTIPATAADSRAVLVDADLLRGLAVGDAVVLPFSASEQEEYHVVRRRESLDGNTSVRGEIWDSAGRYVLSLSFNGRRALATVYAATAVFDLNLVADGDGYVGWLHRRRDDLLLLPTDSVSPWEAKTQRPPATTQSALRSLPLVQGVSVANIDGNDVSIEQVIPDAYPLVGSNLEVTVNVTNISSTTITGQQMEIWFVFDTSTFVSSTNGCSLIPLQTTGGVFNIVRCTIASLAPQAIYSMSYVVTVSKAENYFTDSAVFIDDARNDSYFFAVDDTLTDTDGDGVSDFNESLIGTDANNAASGFPDTDFVRIDLLFLYTPEFELDIGHDDTALELEQLVQLTNDIYESSGARIYFQRAGSFPVNYVLSDTASGIDDLENRTGPFADTDFYLTSVGADIVVLIDGNSPGEDFCGRGTLGGIRTLGDFTGSNNRNANHIIMYRPGATDVGNSVCGDEALAHELGHNLGLAHSRVDTEFEGTFPWSLGHGIDGVFHTVMAYEEHFPGSDGIDIFSSPENLSCAGNPCGISKDDEVDGADAVLSLNTARFAVSQYMGTRPTLGAATGSGGATDAQIYGGAIQSDGPNGRGSAFATALSSQDELNIVGTIRVDSSHVGQTGATHAVISVDGAGFYQVDSSGEFLEWDATVQGLVGYTEDHALEAEETLIAFKELRFSDFALSNINLSVYFAYTVDDELVYSPAPVTVLIQ